MSETMLVECCAPTLAGLKTGSLFSCPYQDREELKAQIRHCNACLRAAGLVLLPLRYTEKKVLLYLYRPKALQRDLNDSEARAILSTAGYGRASCGACLLHLMQRLRENEDFPHEIGLFLSYPPEDVRGFIDNRAKNYKCVGTWKVYGDADAAQRIFERYQTCTNNYCRRIEEGESLQSLAVAV